MYHVYFLHYVIRLGLTLDDAEGQGGVLDLLCGTGVVHVPLALGLTVLALEGVT